MFSGYYDELWKPALLNTRVQSTNLEYFWWRWQQRLQRQRRCFPCVVDPCTARTVLCSGITLRLLRSTRASTTKSVNFISTIHLRSNARGSHVASVCLEPTSDFSGFPVQLFGTLRILVHLETRTTTISVSSLLLEPQRKLNNGKFRVLTCRGSREPIQLRRRGRAIWSRPHSPRQRFSSDHQPLNFERDYAETVRALVFDMFP